MKKTKKKKKTTLDSRGWQLTRFILHCLICILGILVIFILELKAIQKGIDGIALTLSIGALFAIVGFAVGRSTWVLRLLRDYLRDQDGDSSLR